MIRRTIILNQAIDRLADQISKVLFGLLIAVSCLSGLNSSAVAQDSDDAKIAELTFDDLAFEMEKGEKVRKSMLSDEIKDLNGSFIKISGYVLPSTDSRGIDHFVLIRDNQECCYGPGAAALYDCILVKMAEGKSIDFTVRPISVTGKFFIKPYKGPDGNVWAIYRLRDASKN